jgi:hypothetical protein
MAWMASLPNLGSSAKLFNTSIEIPVPTFPKVEISLKNQYFRTDRAVSSRHKIGTIPSRPLSANTRYRRLQETDDAALGSSLLNCYRLRICVEGHPAACMTEQFLRYFNVRFVGSQ